MCTHLLCAQAAAIPHARVPDDRRRDRHDERVDALVLIFPSTAVPVLSPRCVEERPDDARAALDHERAHPEGVQRPQHSAHADPACKRTHISTAPPAFLVSARHERGA